MPGKPAPEEVRREQILRATFEVAAREGLGGVTIRAVAAEAELSHALVLFHFGSKERLVGELLEWLIASTSVLHVSGEIARLPGALDRLQALLEQEVSRLSREPRETRLFFEFWALGAYRPPVRARIGEELERYRATFRGIMAELFHAEPAAFAAASADAMAGVAVSWIQGCAVQAMIDPERFDTGEYLTAVSGVVAGLARRP
jgi:TetR/AcrR family transcriptional regulator, transcriptional repressor of bet genes